MPHLQKIYTELKDKGFDMIAVNANDTPEVVNRYAKASHFTFRIVLGGRGPQYTLGTAYGVRAYPTNYLVGPDGKILWRAVGFDEADLREALGKAGLK